MTKILNREEVKRIVGQQPVAAGGGGGGDFDPTVLNGYATELWVDENYISIEFFSRLFQAHGTENGVQTDIDPNDMDSTITSIESMFGFWTDYYLSALGNGGGLGSTLYLSTLADVLISSPANNQVLTYNASTGKWVNANAQAGVTALSDLTDVVITTLLSNQVLLYDGTTAKWINSDLKTINGQSLIGSGDLSVGGGASGNYLPLSGGTLTNPNWRGQLGINRDSDSRDSVIAFYVTNILKGCIGFQGGTGKPCVWYGDSGTGVEIATVDTLSGYLPLTGGTLTGNLTISNSRLIVGNNAILNIYSHSASVDYIDIWVSSGTSSHTNDRPLVIQEGYGNVGIGAVNPSYKLEVNGTGYYSDALLVQNIEIGHSNEINGSSGTERVHINYRGTGLVSICYGGGNCGIGLTSPSYKLHVSGDIYATGAVTALSDARKKNVLGGAKIGVEQIADAPAVQFLWKGERAKEGLQVGTLAQYWQGVLPEVVMDKGGELSMQYGVAALVSAIITARKVVDHERRISELEKENERLKTEVEQLRLN